MDENVLDKNKIDELTNPKHYKGNIECIDAMEEMIGRYGVINFCLGNAFKYLWRCKKKHYSPLADLHKCKWYIDKAIELLEIKEG